MEYVIGVDLGTSSLKTLLVDQQGNVVKSASENYPIITLKTGYSEQDPKEWTKALDTCLKELLQRKSGANYKIKGISFSGQMHSLVLLDDRGELLRNAILWNDVRTSEQCCDINRVLGDELLEITKNKALEGFTLPKLLWVKEHEPNIWKEVNKFVLPKDYLGFYLTGNIQMDYSDAAGTLLLDVENNYWSEKISRMFDIPKEIMPTLVGSTTKIGNLKKELAIKYGLESSIPIFAGGADNACAAIGAGISDPKIGMVSIGTSGVFLANNNNSNSKGNLHYFNHVIDSSHYSMGVTLAAGRSLSWIKDNFFSNLNYLDLFKNMSATTEGANGLLFAPYIMGERTPHTDSLIRGSFIGIDSRHQKKHFLRAVVEGITFSIKESQEIMEEITNQQFTEIISIGGGSKSIEWLQIQANIFNTKILTLKVDEGPAMGAAMIAAVGSGWYDDLITCMKDFVHYDQTIFPEREKVLKYVLLYSIYKKIYHATKDINHELSTFRDEEF
ncbi:MAG: xylulokinase [Alkalibacterium gilvum]|uniref:xylulokinase n=1 Tax=Alkalibacterium gilvum TaxID=1130080 RepID=UPI003F9148F7